MFWHVFKNTAKYIVKNKEMLFWAFIFPLLLAGFFKMSLSGIDNEETFKLIKVAVIQSNEDELFKKVLDEQLDGEIFEVTNVDETKAKDLLNNKEVVAIINYPEVEIKENSIQASIVENVLNRYKQMSTTMQNVEYNQASIDQLVSDATRITTTEKENMNFSNTYFYTLIGMQSLYGYMFGLDIISRYEANLSTLGKRQGVAPIRKWIAVLASILVAWLLQMAVMFVTLLFITNVLNVSFGNHFWPIFLIVAVGAWVGAALGVVIATSNKKSLDIKIGLGIAISMAMSFLAGMMISNLRYLIEEKVPLLAKINPVHIITNALYSLYYYDSLTKFWGYFWNLVIVGIVMSAVAVFLIRGKQYDSL